MPSRERKDWHDPPNPALPRMPTKYPPGSMERIAEMQRRVDRGEDLFHPHDCNSYEGVKVVLPRSRATQLAPGVPKMQQYIYHDSSNDPFFDED